MYQIVRFARGKKEVVKTGSFGSLTNRLRQLRQSTRKGACGRGAHKKYPVRYEIEETT